MLKKKLRYAMDVFKYQVELGKSGRMATLGYGEEVKGLRTLSLYALSMRVHKEDFPRQHTNASGG